jgi:hypothetical protein
MVIAEFYYNWRKETSIIPLMAKKEHSEEIVSCQSLWEGLSSAFNPQESL